MQEVKTVFESTLEDKTRQVQAAIKELGVALTDEALFGELSRRNAPLQAEADAQANKAAALRKSYADLSVRAESRTRILATEIDLALSEGRDSDADAKKRESEELNASLQEISRQADSCEARVRELEQEQKRNARALFEEVYPALPQATHALIAAVVDLFDFVEQGIRNYAQGVFDHVNQNYVDNLIPHSANGGRQLEARIDKRFGSRR